MGEHYVCSLAHTCTIYVVYVKKVLSRALGPWGGADLRFISPQPDTSRSRKITDTGLVHRVVCPFTPQRNFRWYSLTDPGGMAR